VWRALARNKAAFDPKGCVAAYTKAKALTAAHDNAPPALEVAAAHPASSASVVAAAQTTQSSSSSSWAGGELMMNMGGGGGSEAQAAVDRALAVTDKEMDASDWLEGGKLSPDDRVALAAATATLGDFGAASSECAAAIEQAPQRADLHLHLAGSLQRQLDVGVWPSPLTTSLAGNGGGGATTAAGAAAGARHLSPSFLTLRFGSSAAAALAGSKKGSGSSSSNDTDSTVGDLDGAEAYTWRRVCGAYEDAIGLNPDTVTGAHYYYLGLGRARLGDLDGALLAFQSSARLDPTSVDALLQVINKLQLVEE
jgi:tetratricopeptide (TPR) repeat protein